MLYLQQYPWNQNMNNNVEKDVFQAWKVFDDVNFVIVFEARNAQKTCKETANKKDQLKKHGFLIHIWYANNLNLLK